MTSGAGREAPRGCSASGGRTPTALLTEIEAANELGLSPATLRRWRWAGIGPAFCKIGRAVRYAPEVLSEFVERSMRASTSDDGGAL